MMMGSIKKSIKKSENHNGLFLYIESNDIQ